MGSWVSTPAQAPDKQMHVRGGQRPPTSWWMLSMARLYLSQSLCMLSKLKRQGKDAGHCRAQNKPQGAWQAVQEGRLLHRQSQLSPGGKAEVAGHQGEPRAGKKAEPRVWG